jgi:hypothetical protein
MGDRLLGSGGWERREGDGRISKEIPPVSPAPEAQVFAGDRQEFFSIAAGEMRVDAGYPAIDAPPEGLIFAGGFCNLPQSNEPNHFVAQVDDIFGL